MAGKRSVSELHGESNLLVLLLFPAIRLPSSLRVRSPPGALIGENHMMGWSRKITLAVVPLAGILLLADSCCSAEPQAAFTVKEKWVSFHLTRNGVPLVGARMEVFSENGQPFASGEPGPDGRGEFPLPPGSSFLVLIETGGRSADPIILTHGTDGLYPSEVQLSFGLCQCCRLGSHCKGMHAGEERVREASSDPSWFFTLSLVGFACLASSIGLLILFPSLNLNLFAKRQLHERAS